MKYKVKVSDTVTYARVAEVEVEAANEEEAKDLAVDEAENAGKWDEQQTDNTPYETEILSVDGKMEVLAELGLALHRAEKAEAEIATLQEALIKIISEGNGWAVTVARDALRLGRQS